MTPPIEQAFAHYPATVQLGDGSLTLRRMTADDGPSLQRFAQGLPAHDLLYLRRDITQAAAVGRWIDAIGRGASHSLLAEDGRGLVGYSSLHLSELEWSAHVADLRVASAARMRGVGLGRLLAREAFNLALALGVEKVVARMTPDQKGACVLFQELGFLPEALLRDEVKDSAGAYHDMLVMACNVESFLARRQAYGVDG